MKKAKIISAVITIVMLLSTFAVSANAAADETRVIITPYENLWKEPVEVEAGTSVEWYVSVPEGTELKGCGATVKIPGYGSWTDDYDKTQGHIVLAEGNNLIYKFDALEPGDILFACWMGSGCHKNYIHVTEKISADPVEEVSAQTEESSAETIEESLNQSEDSSSDPESAEESEDTDVQGIVNEDPDIFEDTEDTEDTEDSEDLENSENSESDTDDAVSTNDHGQITVSGNNSGTSSGGSTGSIESVPKTGDDTFAAVWIFSAVFAVAVIFAVKRKKNEI